MGNAESQDLKKLNIILIGKASVGKSTLINSIFNQESAPEGIGSPFTHEITHYTNNNTNLTLYDTPGIDQNLIFKKAIFNKIDEQSKIKNINENIHCIWYCIDSTSNIMDEYEKQIISSIKNIPVIIVLTKYCNTSEASEMMRKIEIQKLNIKYIVPVLAKNIDNEKAFGIDILIYFTFDLLPSNVKASWSDFQPALSEQYQFRPENRLTNNLLDNDENEIENHNINTINVVIVGKTGVGKSTLINSILDIETAREDIGRPVTQEIHEFGSENSIFKLFDTPGFELNGTQQENTIRNIRTLIRDRSNNENEDMHIHCIWYCIRCGSARINKNEIQYINTLSTSIRNKRIPVFIVLTQSHHNDMTKAMIEMIEALNLNIAGVFPIVARDFYFEDYDPPLRCKRYGLDDLKRFSYHQISNHYLSSRNIFHFRDLQKEIKNLRKINVIVIGKPNVGRKTLIKKILGENIANLDDSNSEEIIEYRSENSNYNIYKTPYFDENPVKQIKLRENIINLISSKLQLNDFKQAIHCVWYCIRCEPNGLQAYDIAFIKTLSGILKDYKINVILVLTQCYDNTVQNNIIAQIENEHEIISYYQTIVAENYRAAGGSIIESFGIDELKSLTNNALNNSFIFSNLDDNVRNNYDETIEKLTKINIVTIGQTGVGKSTLINNFFVGHLAATGIGVPVTQRITPLTTPKSPLTIYDTPGFELSNKQQKEMKNDIIKLIKNGYNTRNINKYIHCIWYCINAGSGRFEESDKQFIQELTKETSMYQVPVFVILTQSYEKAKAKRLKQSIENEHLKIVNIIPVVAEDKKNENSICKAYGLDILVEEMGNSLPEALKISFNNVQIASLKYKKKCAYGTVAASVASSAIVGGSPIPFTDCFFIAGIEVSMLSTITAIFNLDISDGIKSTIITSCIGCTFTSLVGKTVITNLLKFIPLAGQIIGGIISGVTGGILTGALGSTYIILMEAILKGEIDPKKITKSELKEYIMPIFKKKIEEEKEKQSNNNNNHDVDEEEEEEESDDDNRTDVEKTLRNNRKKINHNE